MYYSCKRRQEDENQKNVLVGHEGTMRRGKMAGKESKNQVGARSREKKLNSCRPSPVKYEVECVAFVCFYRFL